MKLIHQVIKIRSIRTSPSLINKLNNMEAKELKVQVPEGYEIDKENSTFERIRFKPMKKNITYEDVCNKLFENNSGYSINQYGKIDNFYLVSHKFDANNAPNGRQLNRLLALNQLLNIAEYYNKMHPDNTNPCVIVYCKQTKTYNATFTDNIYTYGIRTFFNSEMDAEAVISNPNFRKILDTIYKD